MEIVNKVMTLLRHQFRVFGAGQIRIEQFGDTDTFLLLPKAKRFPTIFIFLQVRYDRKLQADIKLAAMCSYNTHTPSNILPYVLDAHTHFSS